MNQTLKAMIVDDEPAARRLMRFLLETHKDHVEIIAEAVNGEEAIQLIDELRPDLVFLDIQMKGETGFDLLKRLPEINFALIFVTAFDQYAIKAFRFNAIDYLLKPVVPEELIEAINKVKQRNSVVSGDSKERVDQLYQDIKNPQKVHDKIAIPTGEGFIIIPVNEIVYCHANSNYTEFYLTDKKCIISSYTLKQYDEMLTSQSFFRAHRSYLINLTHVKVYRRGEGGEIVMSNGHEIELSRTHKDEFMRRLNIKQ